MSDIQSHVPGILTIKTDEPETTISGVTDEKEYAISIDVASRNLAPAPMLLLCTSVSSVDMPEG